MAKKRKRAETEEELDDEFGEDEVGTQPLDTVKAAQGIHNMDDTAEKSQAERDLSEKEKVLKKQRELDQEQREAASKEYEEKTEEAKKAKAEQDAADGVEPQEPPPECESFEGYGEFTVPQDMNIRSQEYKKGSTVALSWDDYQALRNSGIYCEPVPKLEPV